MYRYNNIVTHADFRFLKLYYCITVCIGTGDAHSLFLVFSFAKIWRQGGYKCRLDLLARLQPNVKEI